MARHGNDYDGMRRSRRLSWNMFDGRRSEGKFALCRLWIGGFSWVNAFQEIGLTLKAFQR